MIIFVGGPEKSSTRTKIENFQELYLSLAEIGNWKGLCGNLKVDDSVMEPIKFNGGNADDNKRDCLQAYFYSGRATWEEVQQAITKFPINNPRVAKEIGDKHLKNGELKDVHIIEITYKDHDRYLITNIFCSKGVATL